MRRIESLWVLEHFDWYTHGKNGDEYEPTEKAPPEAVEAIKDLNKVIKENRGRL